MSINKEATIYILVVDSPPDDTWSGAVIEMIATDTEGNWSDLFPSLGLRLAERRDILLGIFEVDVLACGMVDRLPV